MSKDIQLTAPCPHLTIEERVFLGSDRRSLATKQPVASFGSVRIMVNDEYYIPQSGLKVPAHLTSFLSGPYNIVTNENDFQVTNGVETVSLTLPVGTRITTNRIVTLFKESAINISAVNDRGRLLFTDLENIGKSSRITVSGKALSALGFESQRGAQGRDLYPAWELSVRPDTITNRYPQFVSQIKTNPIFKVTYQVPVQRCLRCRGVGIENDARYDLKGDVIYIENENLLYQAAVKIILTDLGSNPYHPWYGSTIRSRIGAKALSAITTIINEDVRNSLANLQALQLEQSKYQLVSLKERLYRILSVQTFQSEDDPTVFLVDVTIQNASSDPITLTVVFTTPQATALINNTPLTFR